MGKQTPRAHFDPQHVEFGPLRVINEDRVQPGQGFGTHGHRDMEIISYVLEGALGHKDSMGNAASIVPGEVQRLSAGTGITHSEFNYSTTGTTHFLQIWIIPKFMGVKPGYAQKTFTDDEKRGRLRLVVSHDGAEGSVFVEPAGAGRVSVCVEADDELLMACPPDELLRAVEGMGHLGKNGLRYPFPPYGAVMDPALGMAKSYS